MMGNNDGDIEIDRAFDGILGSRLYALQLEYFDCIMDLQKKTDTAQLVITNIFKLPIDEQLAIIKAQITVSNLCEGIAKKHKWVAEEVEAEDEESD